MNVNDNLPPGCRVSDIPGNSEVDVYVDNYVDDNCESLLMFHDWLDPPAEGNISMSMMKWLLEFSDVNRAWHDHLEEKGEKQYWSLREPHD